MNISRPVLLAAALLFIPPRPVRGCCAVSSPGQPVVNGDQNVIMVWDARQQTQHFIRQASFKSNAPDVGFLVPTPSRPQLSESGDAAFSHLRAITAPPPPSSGGSITGCSTTPVVSRAAGVQVIERKRVAGFDAVVLRASSAGELTRWLRDHRYHQSPAVTAWAASYVAGGWMFTALKIARDEPSSSGQSIDAASLRISFRTDRPLFPYREPDSATAAEPLVSPAACSASTSSPNPVTAQKSPPVPGAAPSSGPAISPVISRIFGARCKFRKPPHSSAGTSLNSKTTGPMPAPPAMCISCRITVAAMSPAPP